MSSTPGLRIKSRLIKGFGAQGFSQAVQIFIRLAEVPLLLSFWGPQLYGEWLILSAIPIYLSIGDGGFATAACREMTIRSGAGDDAGVQAIYQSTWLLLLIVFAFLLLLSFGFVQIAPLKVWFKFTILGEQEIKVVFLILVAHVLIVLFGELLNGGFWVAGKYPNGMYLVALTQFIEFVCFCSIVVTGGQPVDAAAVYLGGRIFGTAFLYFGARRASPWLKLSFSHASLKEIRQLAFPAFATLSLPLGTAMNIQGIRLVLGYTIGPAAVAVFVPLRTLSRVAIQPALIIGRLIQPELALAYGEEKNDLFRRIFLRASQLSFWGCLGLCLIVGPGSYWIFPIWTGEAIALNWSVYLILLIGVILNSLWHTAMMVPYAINAHGRIAIYYFFIYGFMALILTIMWISEFEIVGAAFALIFSEGIMLIVVLIASLPIAKIKFIRWFKNVFYPPYRFHNKSKTF